MEVRDAVPADEETLVAIGLATGLFSAEEADALLRASLRGIFDGTADAATHVARVVERTVGADTAGDHAGAGASGAAAAGGLAADGVAGWTYLTADPSGPPHVWELFWIGVSPGVQGAGFGSALLSDAEVLARGRGARLLLISTSSMPVTARARAFYERHAYAQVGRIPGFYSDGDDKIIYWKAL